MRLPLARRIGSPYFAIGNFILPPRKGRQILHAREFQRIHHFNNNAERSFLVSLQDKRGSALRRQIAHRRLQLVDVDRFVHRA